MINLAIIRQVAVCRGVLGVLGVLIRVISQVDLARPLLYCDHVREPLFPLPPGGGAGYGRHPRVEGAPPVALVRIHLAQVVSVQDVIFTFMINYWCNQGIC